jgi:hypothetical protein
MEIKAILNDYGPNKVAGALVLGNEFLLGATALEDLDVIISPAERKLIINPEGPNCALYCEEDGGVGI